MVSLTVVFAVVSQLTLVLSDLCVLEPLVTISQPLCVQQSCNNSTNSTTRKKRNTGDEIELVPLGSPSAGHFPSVDGDDDNSFNPQISNRFDYSEAIEVNIECNENYTYRTIDGSCNNLKHPKWGKGSTPFLRFLLPRYSNKSTDGIAVSVSGKPLPLPRVISTTLFPDKDCPWYSYTLAVMQWGQLLAHDVGMSPSATNLNIDCCSEEGNTSLPECYPIEIPKNDSFYSKFNQTCQNLIRTRAVEKVAYNCKQIPYQINSVSHYIDLSHLYGSSETVESSLRQYQGGLLRVYQTTDLRDFPELSDNPASDCGSPLYNITCFHSGDKRVNQNTELTCLQTVLLREHNRIAKILANLNPNWSDEKLYQEARKINIAEFQHISYNEWMPLILGNDYMKKHNLKPLTKGYTQYRSDVNVGTFISFMTGAYRIFHSQIQGKLKMYNQTKCPFKNLKCISGRCPYKSIYISDYMNRPGIVVEDNNFDSFLLGLTVQQSQEVDRYFTTQMTQKMFHSDLPYGEDLVSFDIQRGRDHGVPSYNSIRKMCNLKHAKKFSDLSGEISQKNINLLKRLYESVDDIDLYVGAVLEKWGYLYGPSIGPTALCIIGEEFVRKKIADRFWYEVGNQPHSFTNEQLQEIRKSTFSRLLCDNSDNITTIQPNSFRIPLYIGNKIVNCKKLPSLNLTKWKE